MHLTDRFINVFVFVLELRKSVQRQQPSFHQVKETIAKLLPASAIADSGTFAPEDLEAARFAVCAWVDEMLLASEWTHKHLWLKEQLQRTYFNTADAGVEFFERLDRLGPDQREVREVYYLCLALGFRGRFCNDEQELERLKKLNLRLIGGSAAGISAMEQLPLFPEAYPSCLGRTAIRESRFSFSPFSAACLVAPLLMYAILFTIYRFTLGAVAENLLKTVAN